MVKTLKNLGTWYAASVTQVLPSLFKWWDWIDLDLFYGKVKFDPFGKTMDFSETIVVYDVKVGKCSKLNEYMNVYEYQTSRSFIGLVQGHSDSQHFQTSFP